MNLPLFTLRKKTIVVTAVVLLFVFGLFALKTKSRREEPEFTIATCTINCGWPGATAEDVENLVTDALEEAVDTCATTPCCSSSAPRRPTSGS